jgi:CrcB protein
MIINSLLVGIGGFLGAISRFGVSQWLNPPLPRFPYGTLTVNLLGSFLLGWITGRPLSEPWILLFGTGFMGAFTTFSTLKWESIQLIQSKEWRRLLFYLGVSYSAGILLAFAGFLIGLTMK